MEGEVDRVRRLFLSDLAQIKKKFLSQKTTTIRVESQEQLIEIRRVFGASFGAGARCAPKLSDGVLPVKAHSAINAVWPPSSESVANIKRLKKRKKISLNNNVCRASVDCCLPLTNDELLSCGRKCDMIQIKFDHATSIVAVTVVFTRLIVGEDDLVLEILKSIGHNQLVESLVAVEVEVGMEFMRDDRKWMIEEINCSVVTATNSDDEVIFVDKSLITCL